MSIKLNNTQIAELYYYNLHSKLMKLDPLNGTKLSWFDNLQLEDKKHLIDGIELLFKNLKEHPNIETIPLLAELDIWMKIRHQKFEDSFKKNREVNQKLNGIIGNTPEEKQEYIAKILREDKLDELIDLVNKLPK